MMPPPATASSKPTLWGMTKRRFGPVSPTFTPSQLRCATCASQAGAPMRRACASVSATKIVRDTPITAPPMTYSVGGKQYVAVVAGGAPGIRDAGLTQPSSIVAVFGF